MARMILKIAQASNLKYRTVTKMQSDTFFLLQAYVLLTPGVRNPPPLYLTMSKLLPKVIQQNFH